MWQDKQASSKTIRTAIIVVVVLIAAFLIFQLGVFVGYKKASFSYRWGENYHRLFGGPRRGFFRDMRGKDFLDAHGTAGAILKVEGATIVMRGKDDTEKTVLLSADTVIRRGRAPVNAEDLKADDRIVVIGSPNADGHIAAKFIRVFPRINE